MDFRYYLIILLSFTLPISEKISTILIILSVVFSLYHIKNLKFYKFILPFLTLFILYSISYYRDTYEIGLRMFEQKAGFIAFPLIFATLKIRKEQIINVLKAFAYACLLLCLCGLILAVYKSISFNPFRFYPYSPSDGVKDITLLEEFPLQTHHFLGNKFALMQTLYQAMYFIFSIVIFYIFKVKNYKIFIVLLSTGIVLLYSEMGILTIGLFGLIFLYSKYKKLFYATLIIFVLCSGFLGKNKIADLNNAFKADSVGETNRYLKRINERLVIWNSIRNMDKKKMVFGYGYSKSQQALNDSYEKSGFYAQSIFRKKLNAHNQYLQFIIELGIFGLVLFGLLFYNIISKLKRLDHQFKCITASFVIIVLVNALTETLMNRYIGITFFTLFYCMLVFYAQKAEENLLKNNM